MSFFKTSVPKLIAIAIIAFSSCKEDTVLRAKVAPGIDAINVNPIDDTLTILSRSVYIDTLNTSRVYTDRPIIQALGTVTDPFFGTTWSGVYFQVVPERASFSDGAYTLDSAFIILPYTGRAWGDTTTTDSISFVAWEITEDLNKDANYYSNEKKSLKPDPISEQFKLELKSLNSSDSTFANGANRFRHLRIKLKPSFLNKIFSEPAATFESKENFLSWFKGIYIAPEDTNTGHALLYFYLDAASASANYLRAAIEFYYREDASPGISKTAFFNFQRTDCAQFSHISRHYQPHVTNIFNRDNSDTLLLQNEPGAAIDLRIPYLKNLPKGIINKAQLVVTSLTIGADQEKYSSPTQIIPWKINPDGSTSTILDLSASDDIDFMDGTPTSVDIGGGMKVVQYKFNLPREVQRIIVEQQNELHLRLKGAVGFPAAYSLVAGGRNQGLYKLQLNIVYSTPE